MTTVFISYGREDEEAAKRLWRNLRRFGYDVWFDQRSLSPGQSWKSSIVQAIRAADAVIVLLSRSSCTRRGFLNSEIREALENLRMQPGTRPFLIPARLDDCNPSHPDLHELHWVDMFSDWSSGLRQIKKTLDFGKPRDSLSAEFRAFLLLQVDALNLKMFQTIWAIKNVVSVDLLEGPFDVIVLIEAPNQNEMLRSLELARKAPGIRHSLTHFGLATPGKHEHIRLT
jgi:hypothetical protein